MDTYNIDLVRGDPYSEGFDFLEDDEVTVIPQPDTGWLAQIRWTPDSTDAISFAIDTSAAATGRLILSLTSAQTALIRDGSVWDLELTGVRTYVGGHIKVKKDVSRA